MSRRDATRGRLLPIALACLALCLPAAAQRDDKKLIARAQMSMEHQLRTCVWESRTEVTVDGQTQAIEFTRVMHDAKGVRIRAGRLSTGRSDQPLDELDKEGHQLKSALEELAESYAYMDPLKLRVGVAGRSAHQRGDKLGLVIDQPPHVDVLEIPREYRRFEHSIIECRDDPTDAGEPPVAVEHGRWQRSPLPNLLAV